MTDKKAIIAKDVRLKHVYPESLQSYFVSNIVVQHQADSFILSFFETWPPPILGATVEEKQKALRAVKQVEAKCVARLVITPAKMREFLDVMNSNLQRYDGAFDSTEFQLSLEENENE